MVKFGDQDIPPLLAASSIPLHNSFAVLSIAMSLRSAGVQASLTSESGNVYCFRKLCTTCLLTARFSRCIVRTYVNLLLLSLQFRLCFSKAHLAVELCTSIFTAMNFAAFGLPDALPQAGMVQAFGGLGHMEHDAPVAAAPMGVRDRVYPPGSPASAPALRERFGSACAEKGPAYVPTWIAMYQTIFLRAKGVGTRLKGLGAHHTASACTELCAGVPAPPACSTTLRYMPKLLWAPRMLGIYRTQWHVPCPQVPPIPLGTCRVFCCIPS
jgi:hypothetical protein